MRRNIRTLLHIQRCDGAARATRWLGLCLFALQLFSTATVQGAAASEAWVRRYNSAVAGSQDEALKALTDSDGNVIVAGSTDDGISGTADMLVIKYSGAGVALWTNRYNGSADSPDTATAIAVDNSGNVFVTGASGRDYATIAYSGAGMALWTNRYSGPGNNDDRATAVAVDMNGNVFVTGSSTRTDNVPPDYLTIAYSGAGVALWTNRYNGPANLDDYAHSMAVDDGGNVFVAGRSYGASGSRYAYVTIKYSGAGATLWVNRYNAPGDNNDSASAVAVDNNGNVFVTGNSEDSAGAGYSDYTTIAYTGAGEEIWTNVYNGPGISSDVASAIVVDGSGNVVVTGYSQSETYSRHVTIAYSGSGVPLWTNRYDAGTADFPASAVAVDNSGNVFVAGYSRVSGGSLDYATIRYSGAGVALWTNRYNGPANSDDGAKAIAVDQTGNVFVTGFSLASGYHRDIATIAYSGTGVALWTNRYDSVGNFPDQARALALDNNGRVFVTGTSVGSNGNSDYATIAYSATGVALWTNIYNGPANDVDGASAMAVDNNGNVFVTGSSYGGDGSSFDYATIKYSGTGVSLWTRRYNGPGNLSDQANAVTVDNSGNVFVTGTSYPAGIGLSSDYATIKYSGAGVALWTNRYNGPGNLSDVAVAVASDSSGNVFVTGNSPGSGSRIDYATIAYSGVGVPLWTNRYNGPGNSNDQANALAMDSNGNVLVTGYSAGIGGSYDYATIAYSRGGVALWTNRYNGPGNGDDQANAVTVDQSGNVFVTGVSDGGISSNSDFATIAYSAAGEPLWTNRYSGPGIVTARANAVAVDNSGNVIVTGHSTGSQGDSDYATIAYSGAGVALWTNFYNGPANGNDLPGRSCLAVALDGAVYVTGSSDGNYGVGTTFDYATVKYVAPWSRLTIHPVLPGLSIVNLNLSGPVSSSWSIERAVTHSGPWTNLGPSVIGTNGLGFFQDANPPANRAFYRAAQP